MSNGEESGKTGKETLTDLFQQLAEDSSKAPPTVRMRAALGLAVLDKTVSSTNAKLLSNLINGTNETYEKHRASSS